MLVLGSWKTQHVHLGTKSEVVNGPDRPCGPRSLLDVRPPSPILEKHHRYIAEVSCFCFSRAMQSLSDVVNSWLSVNTPRCCCRGPRQDAVEEYTGEHNFTEALQPVILEPDTVNQEFFPIPCIRMQTLLKMDRMKTFSETEKQRVHFVSHEWLSYDHPDPQGRLKRIFEGVIAGNGDQFFADADWNTFCSGHSTSWSQQFAHIEGGAQGRKLSSNSFRQDVEQGLVWPDFSAMPQTIDPTRPPLARWRKTKRKAVQSIPSYLERCSYFWVLTPTVHHVDLQESCNFSSCVEEWTNFLSIPALMPQVFV